MNITKRIQAAALCILICLTAVSCAAEKAGAMADSAAPQAMYDMESGNFSYSSAYDGKNSYSDEIADTMEKPQESDIRPDSARKLIRRVSLELETKEFERFLSILDGRIREMGGYVQTSSVRGSGMYRYASVTARIPTERLDEFCSGIGENANVVRRTETTEDVTLEYVDTESRLKALQSEYDTLLTILEKCTDLKDVISVQSRITEVLYQIESYKSRLNSLSNLVSYSTVSLSVSEVERETVVEKQTVLQRMGDGLSRTFADLRRDGENLLVEVTVNLPYILIWAVILGGGVLAVRGLFRRALRRCRARKEQAKKENPEG